MQTFQRFVYEFRNIYFFRHFIWFNISLLPWSFEKKRHAVIHKQERKHRVQFQPSLKRDNLALNDRPEILRRHKRVKSFSRSQSR